MAFYYDSEPTTESNKKIISYRQNGVNFEFTTDTDVFKLIYKFGDYGCNKSHSVVYSIFSCRMAYLKAHYPEEFYASILSNAGSEEFNNTILEMKKANKQITIPLIINLIGKAKFVYIARSGKQLVSFSEDLSSELTSIKGIVDEIVLVDKNEQKVEA